MFHNYEYIYVIFTFTFSRRFYPKRLTLHSSYSFYIFFNQLLLSLGIEPMILALLAPCSTSWATGKLYIYVCVCVCVYLYLHINIHSTNILYIYISGGPLSALTCCVNVRLLSAIKKISPLIYSQSWVGSWVYTTQAMMTFTLIF